ncbi:GNAT family N-acetyltransferase [Candidatus Pseudothioglobus singularis]|nr:GNAT family N-acetyltransferase [Candidatus Pseudothioglobus singularis]
MSKARQIIELMQPFVEEGRLLERSYENIDSCIDDFVCIEKDNQIIACAGLKLYQDENVGEIYSLVVNKSFHNTDTSTRLMELLIDKASKLNLSSIFALSKYGGRFFFRFEFVESELSFLPDSRQKSYDDIRKSIIYSRRI